MVVYFGHEVEKALKKYLEVRKNIVPVAGHEHALFYSTQRKRIGIQAVENLVKKYAGAITTTKKITPHKLRSTYGTTLYQETGDIYLVADVLGHRDVNTTKKDISKNVLIPDKVTYRKKSYKVTVIDAKAFKNRKNITKVTMGKNITKIGKEAFYGDKKLKTIVIRSTKITFIGKNALKGIDAKATIKVPVKKRNAYSTILKKKGQASTVKIQK